jgi:hypothetical protein
MLDVRIRRALVGIPLLPQRKQSGVHSYHLARLYLKCSMRNGNRDGQIQD